jgi:uncharacterized membrane protein YhdT
MNMNTNKPTRWGWVWLAAFLGFPIGGLIATTLLGRIDNALEGTIGGAIAGLVLGAAQYLALRRVLAVDWRWIVATAVGMAAGVGLSAALFGTDTTLDAILRRAPLTGLLIGIAQAWLLREQVRGAWVWAVVVTLVYVVAWFVTAQVITTNIDQGFVVFGASGALVFQAVTGLALWRLVGHRLL